VVWHLVGVSFIGNFICIDRLMMMMSWNRKEKEFVWWIGLSFPSCSGFTYRKWMDGWEEFNIVVVTLLYYY
jgi:hypothetical protein